MCCSKVRFTTLLLGLISAYSYADEDDRIPFSGISLPTMFNTKKKLMGSLLYQDKGGRLFVRQRQKIDFSTGDV
jgi:hypothetical protein